MEEPCITTPRSGSAPSIDSSKGVFQLRKSKNSQHLDSVTPPYVSSQNDSILRGFLNPGFLTFEKQLLNASFLSFCTKGIHARSCRIQHRSECIFQFHPAANHFKPRRTTRKKPSATLLHSIFLVYHFQHLVELAVVDSNPSKGETAT